MSNSDSPFEGSNEEEYRPRKKKHKQSKNPYVTNARLEVVAILSDYNQHALSIATGTPNGIVEERPLRGEVADYTIASLEHWIEHSRYNELPFHLRDAYMRARKFVNVLRHASTTQLNNGYDVLLGIGSLLDTCQRYHKDIDPQSPVDHCRSTKVDLLASVVELESIVEPNQVTNAARSMLEVCKTCPHRPK